MLGEMWRENEMRVAAKWGVRCLDFPWLLLDPWIYSLGKLRLKLDLVALALNRNISHCSHLLTPVHVSDGYCWQSRSAISISTCFMIFKLIRLSKNENYTKTELSRSCRLPHKVILIPLSPLLQPGLYHAWLVFHSAEHHDCPMKLPAPLWMKPKTNHYGCPIRVIIRLSTGPGDYGVAKWLLWGLN